MSRLLIALLFVPLLTVGAYAFSPQHPEDPHTGWCESYPISCAYEEGGPEWERFVEDRRNGLR